MALTAGIDFIVELVNPSTGPRSMTAGLYALSAAHPANDPERIRRINALTQKYNGGWQYVWEAAGTNDLNFREVLAAMDSKKEGTRFHNISVLNDRWKRMIPEAKQAAADAQQQADLNKQIDDINRLANSPLPPLGNITQPTVSTYHAPKVVAAKPIDYKKYAIVAAGGLTLLILGVVGVRFLLKAKAPASAAPGQVSFVAPSSQAAIS